MDKLKIHSIQHLEQFGFKIIDKVVFYYGKSLLEIVEKYGSPLKMYNLQVITNRINQAQEYFYNSITLNDYKGNYKYCYCTKSNHFSFIIKHILKNNCDINNNRNVHLETSSDFDMDIIGSINIDPNLFIVHNGFKPQNYINSIGQLSTKFKNSICVLDNIQEYDDLEKVVGDGYKIGIRISTHESVLGMNESRFGISLDEIIPFINHKILNQDKIDLKMIHFFISKGICDKQEYYDQLKIYVEKYCEVKNICPSLEILNIGGGFPIHFDLDKYYDYKKIINNIIKIIKETCDKNKVEHPDLFTEFGSYTVGESALNIYKVIREKSNIKGENWYIVDSSFITSIPDSWAINQKFPVLPLNNLGNDIKKVLLGGISCDKDDYISDINNSSFFLPDFDDNNPLYLAVLHTGAYQENLSGYSIGGLSHCQLDGEKILILKENGDIDIFFDALDKNERLKTLGY